MKRLKCLMLKQNVSTKCAKAYTKNVMKNDEGYEKGREDAIEPIKAIIQESEKMMWHSSKTLEKIKEQLKSQTE